MASYLKPITSRLGIFRITFIYQKKAHITNLKLVIDKNDIHPKVYTPSSSMFSRVPVFLRVTSSESFPRKEKPFCAPGCTDNESS